MKFSVVGYRSVFKECVGVLRMYGGFRCVLDWVVSGFRNVRRVLGDWDI